MQVTKNKSDKKACTYVLTGWNDNDILLSELLLCVCKTVVNSEKKNINTYLSILRDGSRYDVVPIYLNACDMVFYSMPSHHHHHHIIHTGKWILSFSLAHWFHSPELCVNVCPTLVLRVCERIVERWRYAYVIEMQGRERNFFFHACMLERPVNKTNLTHHHSYPYCTKERQWCGTAYMYIFSVLSITFQKDFHYPKVCSFCITMCTYKLA